MTALILASTSPYRRELLVRLHLPFDTVDPQVDETPLPGETPLQLATRLAAAKARAGGLGRPDAIVIGSDQVADLDGAALGKPGSHAAALAQVQQMRGKTLRFHTAVAVARGPELVADVATVTVRVRDVSDAAIERYLRLDQPYDCAGSAKVESLGIALLEAVESDDPTALIGLPLIRTCALLRHFGLDPLA
jgi:septum formation protein